MIKKGQLRRWSDGATFMTIGYKIVYGEDRIKELGWGGRHRGRKVWTILEDGSIYTADHIEIESQSRPIDETG